MQQTLSSPCSSSCVLSFSKVPNATSNPQGSLSKPLLAPHVVQRTRVGRCCTAPALGSSNRPSPLTLQQAQPTVLCCATPSEQEEQAGTAQQEGSNGRHEAQTSELAPSISTKADLTYMSDSEDEQPDALASILDEGSEGPASSALGGVTSLVLAFLVGGGYFYRDEIKDFLQYFIQSLQDMGPAGYVAYAVVYAVLELLALPAIPLTMTAGLVFGGTAGTIIVSIAATVAATVSFLIARYLARDRVRKIAYKNPKFAAIDKAIGRDGLKFVTLLRLSPLLPLAASNYLYGLTSVELGPYVLGSWIGMLPGTYAYVNAGVAGRAVVMEGEGSMTNLDPVQVIAAVATTAVALVFIGQTSKKAIEDMEKEDEQGQAQK